MNEKKNDTQSQEASHQWLQTLANKGAINSGLIFALVMSLGVYARYFLKFVGGYQINNIPVLPLILTILGLLLSVIITDVILWKIGCSKPIRSGIWYGLGIGPTTVIWMFEKGRSLLEAITIGAIAFMLVFTLIYLMDMRSSKQRDTVSMVILWIITGSICGLLSLLLRMLGKDYGNFLTGLIAWALFACVMALVTRRNRNLLQFIGGSALTGTLIMVLGMLPPEVIIFIPGGEAISKTIGFAYLSRAVGGAITGLALYYLWRLSENVPQQLHEG